MLDRFEACGMNPSKEMSPGMNYQMNLHVKDPEKEDSIGTNFSKMVVRVAKLI